MIAGPTSSYVWSNITSGAYFVPIPIADLSTTAVGECQYKIEALDEKSSKT
jgi:hypothetical protein